MPKDYAKSSQARRQQPAKRARRKPARPRKKPQPSGHSFSPWSFVSGVVLGVTGVLVVLNGLGVAEPTHGAATSTLSETTVVKPKFEFFDRLPNSELDPDTSPYESDPVAKSTNGPQEFFLQTGSFRDPDDAERMRARLLLEGMQAATREATLGSNGTWFRVVVGPFDNAVETNRALTRLRQQNISALLLKRTASAG